MDLEMFKKEELGAVRVIQDEKGEPWFVLKDIANILGIGNVTDLKNRLNSKGLGQIELLTNGGKQKVYIINEPNLYKVIFRSDKEIARQFEDWVTSEVLPTIRKTGGYVDNPDKFLDNYLPNVDKSIKTLFSTQLQAIKKQNELIYKQRPFVEAYRLEHEAGINISVEEYAKILSNETDVTIGRNKLYRWLKANHYIMDNNAPYQKYVDNGYLVLKKIYKDIGDGRKIPTNITLITPKGKIKLKDKIIKAFKGDRQ